MPKNNFFLNQQDGCNQMLTVAIFVKKSDKTRASAAGGVMPGYLWIASTAPLSLTNSGRPLRFSVLPASVVDFQLSQPRPGA